MAQNSSYNPSLSGNPRSATARAYPNGNPDHGYNPVGVRNTDSVIPLHRKDAIVHSFWEPWFDGMKRLIDFCGAHPVAHVMGCHVEISNDNQDYAYGMTYQPDEAVETTVQQLREAFAYAQNIAEPGIYFTGTVFLCNQTRGTTTIDVNPYRYS